jgi:hypothetical protein
MTFVIRETSGNMLPQNIKCEEHNDRDHKFAPKNDANWGECYDATTVAANAVVIL